MLLVRHKVMNVYRAAKLVSKSNHGAEKLLHEVNLIKNLEHPGIPLIYDIEEDDNSICIIEEYIAGKSLREYMELNENMDINIICRLLIELCSILEYLHNCGKAGIIHLDLKPDNIIIDENMHVWLIDFDNAIDAAQSKSDCVGTKQFAAPEQYHRLKPDKRADIYSLGMLLLYMVNNRNVQSGINSIHQHILEPTIKKCLHHSISGRFENVAQIRRQLEKVERKYLNQKKDSNEHSVIIQVKGTRHGIGATHLCLSMASVLQKMGINAICIDKTYNQHMFIEGRNGKLGTDGTYEYKGVSVLPDYHDRIQCPSKCFKVIIIDAGNHSERNQYEKSWIGYCYNAQYKMIDVIVADGKYGKKDEQRIIRKRKEETAVFVNHMNGMQFYEYRKNLDNTIKAYAIPCIYEWYHSGVCFEKMIREFIQDYVPELEEHLKRNRLEEMRLEITKMLYKAGCRHR